MFGWFETLILLGTIVVFIRLYINKKWHVLKKLNVPHNPPSLLKFGNLGETKENPDSIFTGQIKMKEKYGKIYGSYNGFNPEITIHDPEILKHVYIKEFSTFSMRSVAFTKVNGKELNDGLNVVKGEKWKRIRNTLSPTFSSSKLKDMFGIMQNCANAMVKRLQQIAKEKDGRFQAKKIFGDLSLDVVCSAAFSTNTHTQENDDHQPSKTVEMARKTFNRSISGSPIFMLVFAFPWIEHILEFFNYSIFPRDTVNYFSKLVEVLIKNRKVQEKSRVDLMQLMLDAQISQKEKQNGARKGLTKNEIVGNSLIMILAGYETTANSLIFLSYNLATHKDIQRRVQEEIDEVVEKHGGLTYEAVSDMKYLTMCINESLRLYGAIPRNGRYCEEDIKINGVQILKGMQVIVPTYALSHDEEYWEEPFQYKPERMEDMTKIDPMMFQPFGAGPRNCIGMRFALIEMKLAICRLLQEFNVDICNDTPPPPLQMTFTASMQPKETIYLKVTSKK